MNSSKRMLLLGGSGLLAQAMKKCAFQKGYELCTLTRQNGADLSNSTARDHLHDVFERFQPTLIFNACGITDLSFCENNPEHAWMLNAHLPALIAQLANQTQLPWVHISTDHYFNGHSNVLHTELDEPKPPNVYAASKLAGEVMALTSPTALVIRTNIIGRRGWLKQLNFAEWAMSCLIEQKPFDAYIDTWASSIEVGQFSRLALILSENGETGLINLGCLTAISKAEMIEKMAYRSGHGTSFINKVKTPNHSTSKLKRANAMGLDCTKAQRILLALGYSLPNADEVVDALIESFTEK
jgi:dTDP-4-dehydrorhamnose reductase